MTEIPTFGDRLLHLVSPAAARAYAEVLLAEGGERMRRGLAHDYHCATDQQRRGFEPAPMSSGAYAAALSLDLDKARADIRRLEGEVDRLQRRMAELESGR